MGVAKFPRMGLCPLAGGPRFKLLIQMDVSTNRTEHGSELTADSVSPETRYFTCKSTDIMLIKHSLKASIAA